MAEEHLLSWLPSRLTWLTLRGPGLLLRWCQPATVPVGQREAFSLEEREATPCCVHSAFLPEAL